MSELKVTTKYNKTRSRFKGRIDGKLPEVTHLQPQMAQTQLQAYSIGSIVFL
ncbi:hypothetical protein ACE3MQ_24710 [Paenibacillus lentus]|uniref:hypothetical protein n=1 Tax=Paenibacillus lentus TaxID=1338368 RepID=UPI0036547BC2